MADNNSLAIFTRASQMLAEADTIQKAKELKSLALTAADWAKRKGMGEEAIKHARSYALEAERKMGEMLAQTERANTARDKKKAESHVVTPPTLAELGITKRESAEAQAIANIPREIFDKAKSEGISISRIVKEAKRQETRESKKIKAELPDAKYRVIYADPPWFYGNSGLDEYGHAERHYPTMKIKELCDLPIANIIEENAVLFLWVTSPLLSECWPVIKAWGFEYKTSFVWDKINHNHGHYNSVRHEFLLICTRGGCTPDNPKLFDSVQSIERGKHSEKPEEFRKIIETLYTHGKKIELFARKQADGWATYGNE